MAVHRKTGPEAAQDLGDFVNILGADYRDFVEELTRHTHRTLQQSAFGLFLQCMEAWAELKEHQYDARNQRTVEVCREIVAHFKEKYGEHFTLSKSLPCI